MCSNCGVDDGGDTRMGICFDCATEGDLRLGRRSTVNHWLHGVQHALTGPWWKARIDFKCGWERIWRSGDYASGREWAHL